MKSEQLSHVIDTSMLLTNTYNIYIFMLLIVFYRVNSKLYSSLHLLQKNKNSSADEIANVNFYAVRPEAT